MAKYEYSFTGDFNAVLSHLDTYIMNSAISMNLVDESHHVIGSTQVAVRVYDKYFMRNSSRASLSITLIGEEDNLFICAIGAGGGQGAIFNFSWGAESELVDEIQVCIERYLKDQHY